MDTLPTPADTKTGSQAIQINVLIDHILASQGLNFSKWKGLNALFWKKMIQLFKVLRTQLLNASDHFPVMVGIEI